MRRGEGASECDKVAPRKATATEELTHKFGLSVRIWFDVDLFIVSNGTGCTYVGTYSPTWLAVFGRNLLRLVDRLKWIELMIA